MPTFALHATHAQYVVFAIWSGITVFLVNRGGRHNRDFRIVVSSGIRLIVFGVGGAALLKGLSTTDAGVLQFTDAAVNFVLVLAASIGANYVAHANMNLRDHPKGNNGPKPDDAQMTPSTARSSKKTPDKR
ncbi:hypothetical protein [Burkholderia sp. BCC1998]|uniref:hypothetical protein n=1 Tax=Burkholderia sp. BCC1998 TaxID=2817447 RepID=UPI002AB670BB|nr:hypothetical protein [Burkholderia sp. BCC1998]